MNFSLYVLIVDKRARNLKESIVNITDKFFWRKLKSETTRTFIYLVY